MPLNDRSVLLLLPAGQASISVTARSSRLVTSRSSVCAGVNSRFILQNQPLPAAGRDLISPDVRADTTTCFISSGLWSLPGIQGDSFYVWRWEGGRRSGGKNGSRTPL